MGWNGIEFNEARHNNMSSAALLALNPVFTLSLSFYEFIKPNVRYATKTNHIQVEQTRTTTRIANTSLCCSSISYKALVLEIKDRGNHGWRTKEQWA